MNASCAIDDAKDLNCQDKACLLDNKYRLVLKDAYWIMDGMKIRFIPHQKNKPLNVVFAKVVDNNTGIKEEELSFTLKFEIPGTIFQTREKTIEFREMREMYCIKKGKITHLIDRDGNQYYKYVFWNFSSDLVGVEFDNENAS